MTPFTSVSLTTLRALWSAVDTNPEHPARRVLDCDPLEDGDAAVKALARFNVKRLPRLAEEVAQDVGDSNANLREMFALQALMHHAYANSPLTLRQLLEHVGFDPNDRPRDYMRLLGLHTYPIQD